MGSVAVLIILAAVLVGVYFAVRQTRKVPDPPRARAPQRPYFRPNGIPVRRAGGNINVADSTEGEPPALTLDGDFVPSGSVYDKVGPPALAARIDLLRSDQRIVPENVLFKPGDEVMFTASIVDNNALPIPGVPVFWRIEVLRRDLTLPVLTDAKGYATAAYTVRPDDMIGDPSSPESDTGSYLITCYAGGRALTRLTILYDTA